MTIYLGVNALLYLIIGAWCALKPQETARSIGFELTNLQGLAEYTAVYGGLELALGVFFLLSTFSATHRPTAMVLALCLYAGLVALRVFSIVRHGSQIGNGWYFLALEIFLLIWAAYLITRSTEPVTVSP